MNEHLTDISNVLIIGCGGSGLRAAIEAHSHGMSVKILGKRSKNDAHTVLAAGGINAALGNIDKKDNWEQHFADTFLEGYGIANPELLEILVKASPDAVLEIDRWGANLEKLSNGLLDQRFFGAHTYRRTCYSGDFTGQSILNSLLAKVEELNIPIYDSQYVSDLLICGKRCFGAMSFNINTGIRTVHLSDSVILCTGGHTKIWKRSSSRKNENTGDGYYLALKAGCKLIDMEMVQFHPTGMLKPDEMSGTLVTEAVRGEGGRLINTKGHRFMTNYDKERMELSTRDKVAIANYTEISQGRGTPNGGIFLDISHKSKDHILKKLPKIYQQFKDFQNIDISKEPMEVAPTAHYSMGGILVDKNSAVSSIQGLFAAGEVAGGVHGANRLGGNSLAEIIVFGKVSGRSAAMFSKNNKTKINSPKVIRNAHKNIDNLIKKGDQSPYKLQQELSNIMWENCGVIKDRVKLEKGLKELKNIKAKSRKINLNLGIGNFQDLFNAFDLLASIYAAEASLLSSLKRKESRGAHQRNDFKNIDYYENKNYTVELSNDELRINSIKTQKLSDSIIKIIENTKHIIRFENRLLE